MEGSSHCRYQVNYDFQRKCMGRSQSKIRCYFHHRGRWRESNISFLSLSPLHKYKSCFLCFLSCCDSKSLRRKLWKINTLPLRKFPWQSFLQFPCAVGRGLRWHPSWCQWCVPPLLQLSSDCSATSSKPKDQQLLWKCSHWLQRTLDPASQSGKTLDIPGQPKQPLLTAAAVGTNKDSRDTCLMHLGSDCPERCFLNVVLVLHSIPLSESILPGPVYQTVYSRLKRG